MQTQGGCQQTTSEWGGVGQVLEREVPGKGWSVLRGSAREGKVVNSSTGQPLKGN